MKQRLDHQLVELGLAQTRSQAASLIAMGKVKVNGRPAHKAGHVVSDNTRIELTEHTQYVSRAGNKLESVAQEIGLDFRDKIVLDVGSSTGGFTDFAIRAGAKKVIAVDVGTEQLHHSLRGNPLIELHEKTDIRDIRPWTSEDRPLSKNSKVKSLSSEVDIVVIDVSFISLREILPSVAKLLSPNSQIVAMLKPQFEAGDSKKHKGVIKNSAMRRQILQDFELWARELFVIQTKQDSKVFGKKGNQERFYLLKPNLKR